MKFIIRHLIGAYIICFILHEFIFNSNGRNTMSYIGCNGELHSNLKQSMYKQERTDSTNYKKNDLRTRILQQNHEGEGLHRQHTVRIALFSNYSNAICAGTLQNALYVITVAHCVNLVNASEIIVTAGTWDLTQNRSVTSFEIHEGWNPQTQIHDIALLKLNSSLVLSLGQAIPAKLGLPTLPNASISVAWITGWGLHYEDIDKNFTYPQHEVQIRVSLVDHNTCRKMYSNIGREVHENQICAEREAGYGPCTGDDGAPLSVKFVSGVYYENYVFGILSSYEGCATGFPHIYTDLDKYKSWIESKAG